MSKCELCHYPEGYHSITCPEDKSGTDDIIKLTIKACREYDQKQRVKENKLKHDWKLRNTRLLLDHYNFFKDHIDESICSSDQMEAIDIIAELENCRGSIDIQSIKKSAHKTFVFMGHIDKMISLYQTWCDKEGEIEQRRARILKMFFIDRMKISDILQTEFISEKTCYRDIEKIVDTLSSLIFGIEADHQVTKT